MSNVSGSNALQPPNFRHGMWRRPEYRVWAEMIQRCCRPVRANYKNYGGRGITVCEAWRDSFAAFFRDMGARPEGKLPSGRAIYTIERVDNNAGYSPENCIWATRDVQARNRRPRIDTGRLGGNRAPRALGPVALAAIATGMTDQAIRYRMKQGLTLEEAASKPKDNRGRPRKAA